MRILVIEDEKKLASTLKKSLESETYAVDICLDGESGYETAAVGDYDLIILDVGLPIISGIEVSQKLRAEKITTPILMLTARDSTSDKIKGLDSGADDYLIKPFIFDELLARIRALLRRGPTNPQVNFKVDNLILDPASKQVKRGKTLINLSAKEYGLLEYLLRHENQIISKTQIIDHVWDSELDPFSKVVDVYIGYLRAKIDKAFPDQKPLIKTIKGMGYKIGE